MSDESTEARLNLAVFTTAVLFKEATEDPAAGKWVESARLAEYDKALQAHADYFVQKYKKLAHQESTR